MDEEGKMMETRLNPMWAVMTAATLCAPAHVLGDTGNTASSRITLHIPETARISGLDNIDLHWKAGRNRYYGSDRLCVYQRKTHRYRVSATSANGGRKAFLLRRGNSVVPYAVAWNGAPLPAGGSMAMERLPAPSAQGCGDTGNAMIEVMANPDDVKQVPAGGLYTDVLMLRIQAR
jgi:hypothetical protein